MAVQLYLITLVIHYFDRIIHTTHISESCIRARIKSHHSTHQTLKHTQTKLNTTATANKYEHTINSNNWIASVMTQTKLNRNYGMTQPMMRYLSLIFNLKTKMHISLQINITHQTQSLRLESH